MLSGERKNAVEDKPMHISACRRLSRDRLRSALHYCIVKPSTFDTFEGIHLDVNFGGVARYLHQQNPIGAVETSGEIGEDELDISVSR